MSVHLECDVDKKSKPRERMLWTSILTRAAQDAMGGNELSSVRLFVESDWFCHVLDFSGIDIDIATARAKFERMCEFGEMKRKNLPMVPAAYMKIASDLRASPAPIRRNALSAKNLRELAKLAKGEV